jgi:hypothetical protein
MELLKQVPESAEAYLTEPFRRERRLCFAAPQDQRGTSRVIGSKPYCRKIGAAVPPTMKFKKR